MSDQAKLKESLKKSIKALVISAPLGLTVKEVELDYATYEGRPLPYRQLGYTTCQDFLQDIPDAVRSVWERGHLVVRAVADSSTRHIQSLVSRQKVDVQKCLKKRRASTRRPVQRQVVVSVAKSLNVPVGSSSSSHQRAWRPGGGGSSYRTSPSPGIAYNSRPKPRGPPAVQPSVPAYVQSQLKTFLIAHPNGVQSSHFDRLFSEQFGHTICCTKLGFQSLLHMCQVLSDFIGIQKLTGGEFRIYEKSNCPGGVVSTPTVVNTPRVNQIERRPSTAVESPKPPDRQEESYSKRDSVRPKNGPNHQIDTQWRNTSQVNSARPSGQNSRQENQETVNTRERSPSYLKERLGSASSIDNTLTSDLFETKFLEEIQQVLAEHPEGVWAAYLPDMYKEKFKKTLPMMSLGYYSVTELMAAMPEVVAIEREQKQGDWKLYDVRTYKPKTNLQNNTTSSEANATAQSRKTEVAADPSKGFLELKTKIRQILEQNSEGVYLKSLPLLYKKTFNETFPLEELGLRDIESLVMMMPDIVNLVYKGYGRLLLVLVDESRTVPRNKSIPKDAVGWGFGYSYQDFPPLHDYIEVYVATVFTPHRLCIQLKNKQSNEDLDNLMDNLESVYAYPEGNKYELPESMVAVGQVCCALYLSDNNWHRAIITGIPIVDFIEVLYVDYGTVATVTRSALRLLKSSFLRLPVQAFNGRLAYIEPAEEKWTQHARDRLLALTAGKPLIALITEIQRAELYLLLSDTTTDEDIHINDALVEDGLALFEARSSEQHQAPSKHQDCEFSDDELTQAEFEFMTLQDVTESDDASGNPEYNAENYEAVVSPPEPDETLADSKDEDAAPSSLQNPPPGLPPPGLLSPSRENRINNGPTPNDNDRGSNPSLDSEDSRASDMPYLEESPGDGRWIVKRVDLDEGYQVHLINHENEVCLTIAEVTSFLCDDDSDPEEVLCCLVSELMVDIPLMMADEKEHPRLFRELRRMEVLDSTDLSLDLVTMMPFTSALLLLGCSGTVSMEIVQQLQEKTEDLGVLGDMFGSDVSDNAMDDLGLALELDELKMTLETLQYKRKRIVSAMMQNTDMNFVDELSHIEGKIQEITKMAETTEAIIQQRALDGDEMALKSNPSASTEEVKVTSPSNANESNTGSLSQGRIPDSPEQSSTSSNPKSASKLVMAVEPSLRDLDLNKTAAQEKVPMPPLQEPEVYEAAPPCPPEPTAVSAPQYHAPPTQLTQPDIRFPYMPYAQFPNPEFVPHSNQYFPRLSFPPPPSGYHHQGSGDFVPRLYPNQQSWMEPVPQGTFMHLPPPNLGTMSHVSPPPRPFMGTLPPSYCPNSGGRWMPGPGQGQGMW
ncbi:uncharacterized protein [Asterias amurensis]|uniref:uncharacterized protein n=1 Tax=Asterias amurensis TaxID=7602 RepID=UPI003AB17188